MFWSITVGGGDGGGVATGIQWVGARDAAKHSTMYRTDRPHSKELSRT